MFTKAELMDAINEIAEGRHSIQNCEKLAAIYTVLDHLYPDQELRYYSDNGTKAETIVSYYGKSEFLNAISGKDAEEMWLLMDELMNTLSIINPRLYNGVMRKI